MSIIYDQYCQYLQFSLFSPKVDRTTPDEIISNMSQGIIT